MIGDPNLPTQPNAYPRLITRLYDIFRKIDIELRVYRGEAVINPPNLTSGATATVAVTVSGAAVGDSIRVFPPYSFQGVVTSAYVSNPDEVTVVFFNPSGGPSVDLGSGTWKFKVEKY